MSAVAQALSVQLQAEGPVPLQAEFECGAGELLALVGPSGSGKTSLLRAIAGLPLPGPVQGRIVCGEEVWLDTAARIVRPVQDRRVGLVFQSYALFPHMTVAEQLTLAAGPDGQPAAIAALLQGLGLAHLADRRPAQLSGGQQQRVALGRALVRVMPPDLLSGDSSARGPKAEVSARQPAGVLLLDEPFSAVDAPTRQTLYRELAAWRERLRWPMVLVTHDLQEARRLADRVVIVDAGQTLQTGTPERVFSSPRNARVAELVGIQNHFRGRFIKHEPGWAWLHWGPMEAGIRLRVIDKNRIEADCEVSWVLQGEEVDVGPDGPAPLAPNELVCRLQEALSLGDVSLCTLVPLALPGERITLNLTGRLLRRLQISPGQTLRLRLAPQALHIMPRH